MFEQVIKVLLQLINLVNLSFVGSFSLQVMDIKLKLFYLPRDVAIGFLAPLINFIKRVVELSISIFSIVGPRFFDDVRALRVLYPNVFKSPYSSRAFRVIPEVVVIPKDQKDGVMIRAIVW
jgi:hypothetical protein